MSTIHRTLDGSWAECTDPTCALLFHFPDMTVTEAEAIPLGILLPLLELIQPPNYYDRYLHKQVWTNMYGHHHRDYDLPSDIYADGTMHWYNRGMLHRDFDRPAILTPYGHSQWYRHGSKHRAQGPAVIWPNGDLEWWTEGIRTSHYIA